MPILVNLLWLLAALLFWFGGRETAAMVSLATLPLPWGMVWILRRIIVVATARAAIKTGKPVEEAVADPNEIPIWPYRVVLLLGAAGLGALGIAAVLLT